MKKKRWRVNCPYIQEIENILEDECHFSDLETSEIPSSPVWICFGPRDDRKYMHGHDSCPKFAQIVFAGVYM